MAHMLVSRGCLLELIDTIPIASAHPQMRPWLMHACCVRCKAEQSSIICHMVLIQAPGACL